MPVPGSQKRSAGTRSPTSAWKRAIRRRARRPARHRGRAAPPPISRPTIAVASSRTRTSGSRASISTRAIRAPRSLDADRGLALGRATDLFVANLLVVRGAAHEALDEGPAAAEDYHEALVINDRLLAEDVARTGGCSACAGRTAVRQLLAAGPFAGSAARCAPAMQDTAHRPPLEPHPATSRRRTRAHDELRRLDAELRTADAQAAAPDCAQVNSSATTSARSPPASARSPEQQPSGSTDRRALRRQQGALQERGRTRGSAGLPEEVAVPARTPR